MLTGNGWRFTANRVAVEVKALPMHRKVEVCQEIGHRHMRSTPSDDDLVLPRAHVQSVVNL